MKNCIAIVVTVFFYSCSNGHEKKSMDNQSPIKMKIEEILRMDDPESAIMELDAIVNKLSNYGEDLSKLTEPQKVLLFVENLEREVNNGGFDQFYWNSSGDYADETLNGLRTIGANKMADILHKASAVWPNESVPKDITERQNLHELIQEDASGVWGKCDTEFYAYPDDIVSLLLEYVKNHKKDFE